MSAGTEALHCDRCGKLIKSWKVGDNEFTPQIEYDKAWNEHLKVCKLKVPSPASTIRA